MDASAGDDELILEVAKQRSPELCVANDISWRQMTPLRRNSKSRALNIIFTNHNITELPFAERFDVVLFKNTLHHSRTPNEPNATLGRLRALSQRLIIVDIEDPQRGWFSWLIHLYYVKIYGDESVRFFTRDKFERLMNLSFTMAIKLSFEYLPTIKGTYMIAVIDLNERRA